MALQKPPRSLSTMPLRPVDDQYHGYTVLQTRVCSFGTVEIRWEANG
jgi:hypothetical protein